MRQRIGVIRAGDVSAGALAAQSRGALDRPLLHSAELSVSTACDEALVLGAFQRFASLRTEEEKPGEGPGSPRTVLRRGSGGPEVVVAPGTTHVALALAHPAVLCPCDEKRIVNRLVRPLLRALSKLGCLAHFFGRDWVSVAHRPAAWVGFAHDAASQRTLFEAFIAVRTPFAASARASFLGKAPVTLESVLGRRVDTSRLADAIVDAYVDAYELDPCALEAPAGSSSAPAPGADGADDEPAWAATRDEAIGLLGAGPDARGHFRLGGDLLVSRDALARLEVRAANAAEDELGRIVDETLGAPGVALDGIRALSSVRDLIAVARKVSPLSLTELAAPRRARP